MMISFKQKFMVSVIIIAILCCGSIYAAVITGQGSIIITPRDISVSTQDINFGNITVGKNGGTILLSADGSVSATGDIVQLSGTVLGKIFIKGEKGNVVNVSANSVNIILTGSDSDKAQVSASLNSTNSIMTLTEENGNNNLLNMGGELTISPNLQTETRSLTISVEYNVNVQYQ